MAFAAAAVERAMTYQRVIMRARAGSLTWLQAADILNIYPRSLRRWRARYEQDPKLGLLDRRRRRPAQDAVTNVKVSPRRPIYAVEKTPLCSSNDRDAQYARTSDSGE
jgi:hypothetical protein